MPWMGPVKPGMGPLMLGKGPEKHEMGPLNTFRHEMSSSSIN